MSTDSELLNQYVHERAEVALAELVHRHANLVYGAALRQLDGDVHRARDVAQSVFTDMLRKAPTLAGRPTLAGWLHTSTRYAAVTARRADRTRDRIECAAAEQQALGADVPAIAWERLRPVIDEAIAELTERDRDAVLLRYFEGRPFAEVGAAFGLSPDAARMRVERALEKLRELLERRGVTSTAAAIGLTLESAAAAVAPAGLAEALAAGAMVGGSHVVAGAGLASIFQSTHLGTATAVLAAIVAVGAAFYEGRRARLAEETAIAATLARDAAMTRASELAAKAAAAAQPVATRPLVSIVRSPAAPIAPAEGSPDAEAMTALQAGRQFLATNPEAERVLQQHARTLTEGSIFGAGLRKLGLTAPEYEQAISHLQKTVQVVVRIGDLALPYPVEADTEANVLLQRRLARADMPDVGRAEPFGDQLPEFLGEVRVRELREHNFSAGNRSFVTAVAAATFDTDEPLSPAQAGALYEIVTESGPRGKVFDREGALQKAQAVLSPLQFSVFSGYIARRGFGPALLSNIPPPAAEAKK